MKSQSYSATIEVALPQKDVFTRMNHFKKWWTRHIEGESVNLNDEFILRYGDAQGDIHYSKHKLIEVIPDKKIVSLVTESKIDWIEKDPNEWTNTKMVFELTPKGDRTELKFTHEGLLPEKECYTECAKGWDTFIKQNLYAYLSEGKVLSPDFKARIATKISPDEAIKKISDIPAWWDVAFTGSAEKQNDTFVVKMGGDSFFDFTVAELIPGKRVVWLVTDCHMPWYSDKKEWANTKLIFDLTETNGLTHLTFTHEGLTPEVECYNDCEPGWTHWIKTSLFSYFTTGKGDFNRPYAKK
jgi:predicted lipoprotein with Yx(FWY)xxD motif